MNGKSTLQGTIPDAAAGQRLDQALAQLFDAYSRSRLTQWLKAGQVQVDGQIWRGRDKVRGGEQVIIQAELEEQTDWQAEAMPLDIQYEDEQILIIDKPAGQVVHPAAGNPGGTLVNALLHYAPALAAIPRAGIVHRLDKGTSGLLVVARTLTAQKALVEQLQAHSMLREYQAIATGVLTAGGTVEAALGRHPKQRKRMAVTPSGKPAVTHYRVIERFRAHTWIRCTLETGRTHQIRVHMAYIHHPLLGDPVYGGRLRLPRNCNATLTNALQNFKRQALHAGRLGLVHPGTGDFMEWQSPLPADMDQLIELLREDVSQNTAAENNDGSWEYLDE